MMQLNRETPIMIYGASLGRGYLVKEKLSSNGFNVLAFLDRNGDNLEKKDETPILLPEEIGTLHFKPCELLVIITVTNRFAHKQIVLMLKELGVKYLLFQQATIETAEQKNMDLVFQEMLNPTIKTLEHNGKMIPALDEIITKNNEFQCIHQDKNTVTTYVPSELLFSFTKELLKETVSAEDPLFDQISDKNINYYNHISFLYESEDPPIIYAEKKNRYRQCRNLQLLTPSSDKELAQNLRDRYDIFEKMQVKLECDPLFFHQNPCDVLWNPKGYFNIQDGNNRAYFLFSKNIFQIPCSMSRKDFEAWVNENIYQKTMDLIHAQKGMTLDSPIPHPYLANLDSNNGLFFRRKLKCVGNWLYQKKLDPKNLCVLDVDSRFGFHSQWFSKMGSNVVSFEKKSNFVELQRLFHQLLYDSKIEVVERALENFEDEKKFDLVIVPFDLNLEENMKYLEDLTAQFMLIELEAHSGLEERILNESSFTQYQSLKILNLNEKLLNICIFMK